MRKWIRIILQLLLKIVNFLNCLLAELDRLTAQIQLLFSYSLKRLVFMIFSVMKTRNEKNRRDGAANCQEGVKMPHFRTANAFSNIWTSGTLPLHNKFLYNPYPYPMLSLKENWVHHVIVLQLPQDICSTWAKWISTQTKNALWHYELT